MALEFFLPAYFCAARPRCSSSSTGSTTIIVCTFTLCAFAILRSPEGSRSGAGTRGKSKIVPDGTALRRRFREI